MEFTRKKVFVELAHPLINGRCCDKHYNQIYNCKVCLLNWPRFWRPARLDLHSIFCIIGFYSKQLSDALNGR